jgi:hypothetical protein
LRNSKVKENIECNYPPKLVGGIEFLLIIGSIGGMNSGAEDDSNKEACHTGEQNLCPVDAVVQEVVQRRA